MLPAFCMATGAATVALPDSPQPVPGESLSLVGSHYEIYCFENNLPTAATSPRFAAASKVNYELRYEDHAYDLTESTGFSGYFDLSRWQKTYGDGGVDVTGAPNVATVEGADATLVELIDQRPVMLEIDIPAEGYVRFDWKKIGGSYFSLEIAAASERFFLKKGLNGHYISPILQAGDRLRLTFDASQEEGAIENIAIQLENFHFYSNAVQVIVREWQAMRKNDPRATFTQYISVQPLNLDQVVFPAARQFYDLDILFDPWALAPEATGFPYVDKDDNEQTSEDRYYLDSSNCAYSVSWEDELLFEENSWTLLRHWRISDLLSKNITEKTQVIKLYTDASDERLPWQMNEKSSRNLGIINPRLVIQYLDWEAPND
jgi:hypothetical protein